MGRFLGRLGSHQGFAVRKLHDGSIVESSSARVPEFAAYVAACSASSGAIHWYGLGEYPPTEQGERAAVDEWENLHARHLLTATTHSGISADITALLRWLDSLTVESPVAMLSELSRVQCRSIELTEIAVQHARHLGMTWALIGHTLGLDEAAARGRYVRARGDEMPDWPPVD